MGDRTYSFVSRMLRLIYWHGTLLGRENLPPHGPAVVVANHHGPDGPVSVSCAIPLRMHPWIISNMIDRQKAPDYLRMDFVEPSLKLKPPLSVIFAKALCRITVPLLTALGCIPVTRGDGQELTISLDLLIKGKVVLIFPEAPELDLDPLTEMRPFLKGFTRLGEMYFDATGEQLRFYPVAVLGSKRVRVGEAVLFDPEQPRGAERLRLKHLLEDKIKEMYLESGG